MHTHTFPAYCWRECGRTLEVSADRLLCPEGHGYPVGNGIVRFVPSDDYAVAFGPRRLAADLRAAGEGVQRVDRGRDGVARGVLWAGWRAGARPGAGCLDLP